MKKTKFKLEEVLEVPDTVSRDHTITDPADAEPSFDNLGNKFFKSIQNNLNQVPENHEGYEDESDSHLNILQFKAKNYNNKDSVKL